MNWRIARARLGRRVSELEANAMEKHPLIFSILFLVTLSQAIKFLGLQGLPWTKVWAGIYLCSYVVLAIVRALASKDWLDRPPRVAPLGENALFKEKLLGIIRIVLLVVASAVHVSVSCWALSYTQYQYRWVYEESFGWIFAIIDASRIIFFLCIAVSLITLLPWVLFLYLMGGNLTWISFREQIVQRYIIDFENEQNYMGLRRENDHFLMLELMPVAVAVLLSCILYSLSWVFGNLFMTILMIIDGGSTLTLCFSLLFLLFTIMSAISKRVGFLSFLKFDDGDYKALLVFPFFNFLVALLYYRYVYDPTGTVKPSWTESLG